MNPDNSVIFSLTPTNTPITRPNFTSMKTRQDAIDEEIQQLTQRGHKCIRIGESFPVRMSWCEQEPCVRK